MSLRFGNTRPVDFAHKHKYPSTSGPLTFGYRVVRQSRKVRVPSLQSSGNSNIPSSRGRGEGVRIWVAPLRQMAPESIEVRGRSRVRGVREREGKKRTGSVNTDTAAHKPQFLVVQHLSGSLAPGLGVPGSFQSQLGGLTSQVSLGVPHAPAVKRHVTGMNKSGDFPTSLLHMPLLSIGLGGI